MALISLLTAWGVALVVTALLGFWLLPVLRKLKFGQIILDIGPKWHEEKQGTPTMGGLLFIAGILLGVLTGFLLLRINININLFQHTSQNSKMLLGGVIMALAFGMVGFVDDYLKVLRKENEGLTERQKIIFQAVISVTYIIFLYSLGERSTIVWIPFIGQLDFGLLYYPLAVGGIMFIINAVNFTDGVDGLCTSVTLVVGVGFLIIASVIPTGHVATMQVLSAALIGGCMGFLIWNIHPAKVFMGDTGSFFLGGIVVALAFGLKIPLILILMGAVYSIEAVTVIIQRVYFKYTRRKTGTGQRLFKMTPIHHSFELSGWKENKIVLVFSAVQGLFVLISILAVLNI